MKNYRKAKKEAEKVCVTCQLTDVLLKTLVREAKKRCAGRDDAIAALAITLAMLLSETERDKLPAAVNLFTECLIQNLAYAFGLDLEQMVADLEEGCGTEERAATVH